MGIGIYAVFKSGGKQHLVREGEIIILEKLNIDIGQFIEFSQVLIIAENNNLIRIGNPTIQGCNIQAKVIRHGRSEKVKIIKFHRRKHSRKQQGHRQWFTKVKITKINFN